MARRFATSTSTSATYTGTKDQNYMFEYVKINECLLEAMPTSRFLNDGDDDDVDGPKAKGAK